MGVEVHLGVISWGFCGCDFIEVVWLRIGD